MDWATARRRLQQITAARTEPTLDDDTIDDLLVQVSIADEYDTAPDGHRPWRGGSEVVVGETIVPTTSNGNYYTVTDGGTLGSTQPTWPEDDTEVESGNATLVLGGTTSWNPTFRLALAAASGWQLKAAACAHNFSFSADGTSASKQQVYDHCVEQHKLWLEKASAVDPFGMVEIRVGDDYGYDVIGNINQG